MVIDISNDMYMIRCGILEAAGFISAPHVRMHPSVFPDGNMWCCLYGENLMEGVAGFGETPAEACAAFDKAWWSERTPASAIEARRAATPKSDAVHESAVPKADAQ